MRSLSKGGSDYALGLQDRVQDELPETVVFEFDSRNPEADLANANVHLAWARAVDMLVNGVKGDGSGVLDVEEGRSILAVNGILDPDLTAQIEDTVVALTGKRTRDDRPLRIRQEEYRDNLAIMRAADLFPREPIIRVHYPTNHIDLLFERGEDLYARTLWASTKVVVLPQPELSLQERAAINGTDDETDNPHQLRHDDLLAMRADLPDAAAHLNGGA
jgi:hypothetical protein